MDQPLFIAIAAAAVTTIMVVVAALGWLLGMELGPLATWLSGAASATAVVVALRGHRLVADQRAQDKDEKREAAAHQVTLKVTRLLERIAFIRHSYRTDTRTITFGRGKDTATLLSRAPIRRTLAIDPFLLSDEQENLLVSLGALAQLRGYERALSGVRNVTEMVQHHVELWQELTVIAPGHPIVRGDGDQNMFADEQPEVLRNLITQSALIKIISEQLTMVGDEALAIAAPVEAALRSRAGSASSQIDATLLTAELAHAPDY